LEDIYTATSSSGYDNLNNFENKELIGDSVLKFITCYCLYMKNPDYTEAQMSAKKSQLVSNYNLMLLGQKIGLEKYIFTMKKHPKTYTPTGLNLK